MQSAGTRFSRYRLHMIAHGQGWTHRFEDPAACWNAFDRMLLDRLRSALGIVDIQSAR
ncbi:MAG: hypothetical protein KGJ46_05545 [Xanthomonadaceae bacterium]|nr:hypothetical protein [Xanthomonadaceae bacterium]MDE2224720.1 hypothetical protein [Xanthomonadaceae bacterium]